MVIGLAREHRMPLWGAQATMCRGFALVGHGRYDEGLTDLRTGLAEWNGIGARFMETQWLGLTTEAYIRTRRLDDALAATWKTEGGRISGDKAGVGDCGVEA